MMKRRKCKSASDRVTLKTTSAKGRLKLNLRFRLGTRLRGCDGLGYC